MKKCPKCGEVKPLSDFAKDKYRSDGHQVWCRACSRAACANAYIKRKERQKADTKNRRALQPRKHQAHAITTMAITSKMIDRPANCQKCGIACRPEAHHDDYKWPLKVRWLCRVCHIAWHQKNTPLNEDGDPSVPLIKGQGKKKLWDWDAIKKDGI